MSFKGLSRKQNLIEIQFYLLGINCSYKFYVVKMIFIPFLNANQIFQKKSSLARNITYQPKISKISIFLMKICTQELLIVNYTSYTLSRTYLIIQKVPEKTILHLVHYKINFCATQKWAILAIFDQIQHILRYFHIETN